MKSFLIAMLMISTASAAAGATTFVFSSEPRFDLKRIGIERSSDEAAWRALGQRLALRENYSSDAALYILKNIHPRDRTITHQADWLTTDILVGNDDGSVEPAYVRAISEAWVKNSAGNWEIDQWFHVVTRTGELSSVSHQRLVETPSGSILSYEYVRTGPVTDPAEQAQWKKVKQRWFDFIQPR